MGCNNKNTVKLQGSFFHSNFKENLSFPSSRGLDMMEYPFLRLAIYIGNNIFSVFFYFFFVDESFFNIIVYSFFVSSLSL